MSIYTCLEALRSFSYYCLIKAFFKLIYLIYRINRLIRKTTTFTAINLKIMKNILTLTMILLFTGIVYGQQKLSPLLDFGNVKGTLASVRENIKSAVTKNNFNLIGEYQVAGKSNLYVLVFSNNDLIELTTRDEKSGLLAAAFKVALIQDDNVVNVSTTTPEYTFLGFLRNNYDKHKSLLKKEEQEFINVVKSVTSSPVPFGGSLSESKLKDYRYMVSMPYFKDFVELATFPSFNEGLKIIQANLTAGKGSTRQVYKLTAPNVAVFGVGLSDQAIGEAHFLPIIGEKHIAALPYEIFLIDNKAYILHGRFRFAFYWPDLKMGTFMKIVSTPGDVKNQLKGLTIK